VEREENISTLVIKAFRYINRLVKQIQLGSKKQKDFTFYLFIYDIKFTLEPSKKTLRDVDIQLSYIFSHGGGKGG